MKTRRFLMWLLFAATLLPVFAQEKGGMWINRLDGSGQRTGWWTDTLSDCIVERARYAAGLKEGAFRRDNYREGRMTMVGEYRGGELKLVFFMRSDGTPASSCSEVFRVGAGDDYPAGYAYGCRYVEFYPSGMVKSDGTLLWNDFPWPEKGRKHGVWKLFDEEGNVKEERYE